MKLKLLVLVWNIIFYFSLHRSTRKESDTVLLPDWIRMIVFPFGEVAYRRCHVLSAFFAEITCLVTIVSLLPGIGSRIPYLVCLAVIYLIFLVFTFGLILYEVVSGIRNRRKPGQYMLDRKPKKYEIKGKSRRDWKRYRG